MEPSAKRGSPNWTLGRKVSRQLDHRGPLPVRQKKFSSQMATRRPDFSSPEDGLAAGRVSSRISPLWFFPQSAQWLNGCVCGQWTGILACVVNHVSINFSRRSPRLLRFSPLHPYTHRTQRLVWVPWCDSRNRASQYQIEAASWQRRADRMRAE